MAKLPVELHGVPVNLSVPTGEIAKATGENGGRTSEEPLSEPHIEPLRKEAAPPSSFGNDVVAAQKERKGLGEQSEPKKIPPASEHLARHLKEIGWVQ